MKEKLLFCAFYIGVPLIRGLKFGFHGKLGQQLTGISFNALFVLPVVSFLSARI